MTAPDELTPAAPPVPAKRAGLWEDFIDIFISPSEVFERRRDANFFPALLVFVVLSTAIFFIARPVLESVFDAEFARSAAAAMRKNPAITQDQMDKGRAMAQKFQIVGLVLGAFFLPMIVGCVLWIAGKLVSAKENIGQACMIATYAMFPRIIEGLVNAVQGFTLDPATLNGRYRLTLGLGRFLDPDTASPVLLAVIGRIDIFTIWVTILLGIGLAVVARIPRARAFAAAAVVWVIGMLPGLWGAIRAS
jgi:hypothetical protein